MSYQHRLDGEIKEHPSLRAALRHYPFDKVSFEVDGGRLILRGDGTWEYWDNQGTWNAEGFKAWEGTPAT